MHTSGEKNRLKRTYSRKPARESPEGDIFEFRGDDDLPIATSSKPKKVGRKPSQLDVAVPLEDVYQAAAQTVNPLDTLNQKPVDPSPLHSSAFLSPTNASDPYSHAFGTPSQQLPSMGPGFEEHEPNIMFPEMSSTIAASSSSLEKRMTPQTMKTATPVHQLHSNDVSEEVVSNQEHTRMTDPSINSTKQVDDHTQLSTADSESKHIDTRLQQPPPKKVRQQQKKRKAETELPGPDLSSEARVGLPKENYKPRPSRSRSALPSQAEPLASLESSSSSRSKNMRRSRTGGSAVGGMSNETTQKLIEMGFTAADSEAALIGNDWVFERALETLIARGASRSRSPEVVKSKAQVTEVHEVVKEPVTRNEGSVVIYTSPMRGEQGQGASRINGLQHGEVPKQAHSAKELDETKDSTNGDPKGSIVSAGQDQIDEAQAVEQAPSPSNTKIKRTKSTKTVTKQKKHATVAEADHSDAKQSNTISTGRTDNQIPAPIEEQNKDKQATTQNPSQNNGQSTQENSDRLKPEKQDASTTVPKVDSDYIPDLPQHKTPQASTNEVIEIDDDSDDGPPVVSKKLRRTKTAPAAALKKEKKKKGKKGKSKQLEQAISEEKVVEEDVDEPKDGTREVLQKIDGNAASSVVNDHDKPADEAMKDVVVPAKSKKADTKATKKAKAAAKSAKTIHDSDEEEEDRNKPAKGDEPSEPAKPSKSATKKTPEPTNDTQDEHAQTTNKETTPPLGKDVDAKKKEKKKPHSPIKRVTYRVGLSKRTRIEPLLKMRR